MKITGKEIMNMMESVQRAGGNSDVMFIPKPKDSKITIAGTDYIYTGQNNIANYMGIEIWVDDTIEDDRIYLLDKKDVLTEYVWLLK